MLNEQQMCPILKGSVKDFFQPKCLCIAGKCLCIGDMLLNVRSWQSVWWPRPGGHLPKTDVNDKHMTHIFLALFVRSVRIHLWNQRVYNVKCMPHWLGLLRLTCCLQLVSVPKSVPINQQLSLQGRIARNTIGDWRRPGDHKFKKTSWIMAAKIWIRIGLIFTKSNDDNHILLRSIALYMTTIAQ